MLFWRYSSVEMILTLKEKILLKWHIVQLHVLHSDKYTIVEISCVEVMVKY